MRFRKAFSLLCVLALAAAWIPGALAFGSAPTADGAGSYGTSPGNDVGFNVSGSDPDGDPISFELAQDDGMGGYTYSSSLTLTTDRGDSVDVTMSPGGSVSVHPQTSNAGVVTINYVARDGSFTCGGGTSDVSSPASVQVRWNNAPVADALSFSTPVDTAYDGNLTASDGDGDALNFYLASGPSHGSASVNGDGPFHYEPSSGFEGADSFQFYVDDSQNSSYWATVTVTVGSGGGGNAAPSVNGLTLTGPKNVTLTGAASATDPDGDPMTFTQDSSAAHGTASISATGAISFAPTHGWSGNDSFTFHVSDDHGNSSAGATVNLVITNSAPTVAAVTLTTYKNSSTGATFTGTDLDGDALTFTVGSAAHGTPSVVGSALTYVPTPGYAGADSFSYSASDGTDVSASGTVTVQIVDRAPTALPLTGSGSQGGQIALTLSGSDPDGDSISFRVVQFPAHGTVGLTGSSLTYVPAAGYAGSDSLTYAATDGSLEGSGAAAALTVHATAANHAPTLSALALSGSGGTVLTGAASASDADGDTVTFLVSAFPAHGGVSLSGSVVSYVPNPAFSGSDSFTLRATDGSLEASAPVTVTVYPATVVAVNHAPSLTGSVVMSGAMNSAMFATLTGSDADHDALVFEAATYPSHGWLRLSGTTAEYYPEPGYAGADSFTYRAFDGADHSATGTATIAVLYSSGNRAPTVDAGSFTVASDQTKSFTLSGSDADGDAVSFSVVQAPAHGTVTFLYAPTPGYVGADAFSFRSWDATLGSSTGSMSVSVTAATPIQPSSGGSSRGSTKDYCPQGDTSPSYYDGLCGAPACPSLPALSSAPAQPDEAKAPSYLSSTVYVVQDWCPYSDEDYASIDYADIKDSPEKEGIETFTRNCVVRGRTRQAFVPSDTTTRAEMAAIAIRATGVKYDLEGRKSSFSDVPLKDWKTGILEKALKLDAIEGAFHEDGKFYAAPEEKISRAEAVRIALASLSLYRKPTLKASSYGDIAKSDQLDYLLRAEELGILKASVARGKGKPAFRPDAPITRQDAIRLVKEALKRRYQEQLNGFVQAGEIQVAK